MEMAEFWDRLTIKSSWHISDSEPVLLLPLKSVIWSGLTCGFRLINTHETHTQSRTGTVTNKFHQFVKHLSLLLTRVEQKCNIAMLTISDVCHVVHTAAFKKPVSLKFPLDTLWPLMPSKVPVTPVLKPLHTASPKHSLAKDNEVNQACILKRN